MPAAVRCSSCSSSSATRPRPAADVVVDLGPGAGTHGGQVVAVAPSAALAATTASYTGGWLRELLTSSAA